VPPYTQNREGRGEGKPETFTFLGFTHYCGKRRSNGAFTVRRKTAKKRMVVKLHAVKAELRLHLHEPVAETGAWLRKVVTGYRGTAIKRHSNKGNIQTARIGNVRKTHERRHAGKARKFEGAYRRGPRLREIFRLELASCCFFHNA
jgi:hypothetical protein